jgi:hypothetical protein
MAVQRGATLAVRSVPASASQLAMDLSVDGRVLTGTWAEQEQAGGRYRGAVYMGAIQLIEDENPAPRLPPCPRPSPSSRPPSPLWP